MTTDAVDTARPSSRSASPFTATLSHSPCSEPSCSATPWSRPLHPSVVPAHGGSEIRCRVTCERGRPCSTARTRIDGLMEPMDADVPTCRHTNRAHPYCFDRDVGTYLCVQCAVWHRPVLRRAIIIALVVGTLLALINQGDVLLHGHLTVLVVMKICLTYTVPFAVSTGSALAANRV